MQILYGIILVAFLAMLGGCGSMEYKGHPAYGPEPLPWQQGIPR